MYVLHGRVDEMWKAVHQKYTDKSEIHLKRLTNFKFKSSSRFTDVMNRTIVHASCQTRDKLVRVTVT